MFSKEEELQLVLNAQQDFQAFSRLYDHYLSRIYAYCFNRIPHKANCEDVVSEVFVNALENLASFDVSKNIRFGTWLYAIAHNKIVDHFRRNKKIVSILIAEADLQERPDLDEFAIRQEQRNKVAYILSLIKPRYQEAISLRYFSDLDNFEISLTLRLSPEATALLIHRALVSFREKFLKNYPESEIFDLF